MYYLRRCKEPTGKLLELDKNGSGEVTHSSLRMGLATPHRQSSNWSRFKNPVSRRPEKDAKLSSFH